MDRYKVLKQEMMVLLSEKIPTLTCHKLLSANVGIFSLSYV